MISDCSPQKSLSQEKEFDRANITTTSKLNPE